MLARHQSSVLLRHAGTPGRAALPSARHPTLRGGRSGRLMAIRVHASSKVPVQDLLAVAIKAAEAGAKEVNDALDKPRSITLKGTADLVTETDKASEAACLAAITAAFPGHAILGEEGGVVGDAASSEYLWCVDPLDGTTNFAHGYPSFGVSVGVLRGSLPLAACVVEFAGGAGTWVQRKYTASRNGGAFMNGKPISVSGGKALEEALLVCDWPAPLPGEPVTGFGYDHDAAWRANIGLFEEFTDVTRGVRRLGAAAVDLCHVAQGNVDAYWEFRLKPWDTCAGILMVEEAGGRVTTMDGLPYSVFERSLLASNDRLHAALLARIEPKVAKLRGEGVDFSQWFVPKGYRVRAGAQLPD